MRVIEFKRIPRRLREAAARIARIAAVYHTGNVRVLHCDGTGRLCVPGTVCAGPCIRADHVSAHVRIRNRDGSLRSRAASRRIDKITQDISSNGAALHGHPGPAGLSCAAVRSDIRSRNGAIDFRIAEFDAVARRAHRVSVGKDGKRPHGTLCVFISLSARENRAGNHNLVAIGILDTPGMYGCAGYGIQGS